MIICPYRHTVGGRWGLLESMMTATIVNDLTRYRSRPATACKGQGYWPTFGSGLLGGMAGCA